jgi:hypothetical protein
MWWKCIYVHMFVRKCTLHLLKIATLNKGKHKKATFLCPSSILFAHRQGVTKRCRLFWLAIDQ